MLGLMMAYVATASASISGNDVALKFNPEKGTEQSLTLPDGKTVKYRAYEHIYYVTNIEDSTYQYLNLYVPENVAAHPETKVPIFLRTYVGGYMAAKAMSPSGTDATGRALAEGYIVCIPGSRGRNSTVMQNGETIFTGRAPAAIADLKAAIRYLRYNSALIPGDTERIITDGTSAGGAMSALLGATGNSPLFEPYLKAMGAAPARDDVFAAVCYCPIIDLEHADMAYEWLYQCTNTTTRNLTPEQIKVSEELAALYPAYLNSLQLKTPDGTPLTDANFLDYIKSYIIQSAQKARAEGCELPENIGIRMYENRPAFQGNGHGERRQPPSFGAQGNIVRHKEQSEFVADIDMEQYLNYVVTTQPLKNPPAFDALHVLTDTPTGENEEFGNSQGSSVNFSAYSIEKTGQKTNDELEARVFMMNPMNFIKDKASNQAPNWYIRHGARDRDTSFPVPVSLATMLMNNGFNVNFALPWNRPHTGDYNLDDLFTWIKQITQ